MRARAKHLGFVMGVTLAVSATGIWADESSKKAVGTDVLLNALSDDLTLQKQVDVQSSHFERISSTGLLLTNPFTGQLYSLAIKEAFSREAKSWLMEVLQGKHEKAAHLWSVARNRLPASFEVAGRITFAYLLWQIEAYQSAVDEWLTILKNPSTQEHVLAIAFEETILPSLPSLIEKRSLYISKDRFNSLSESFLASPRPAVHLLYAYAWRNSSAHAEKAIAVLPINSELRMDMAEAVIYAKAKKSELGKAAVVLKRELEPYLQENKNPEQVARHYLMIGRLLFQSGNLESARDIYEKIPRGSGQYISAQEELAWVLLKLGDQARVRGVLKSFESGAADRFTPEAAVMHAISSLKMCEYDAASKAVDNFVKNYGEWSVKIDAELAKSSPEKPPWVDKFSEAAETQAAAVKKAIEQTTQLESLSVSAALPAVGVQSHWTEQKLTLEKQLSESQKEQSEQYRRQWSNMRSTLKEAIRKMRFVRVELMSQLQFFSDAAKADTALVAKSNQDSTTNVDAPSQALTFNFDGVVWPDELFTLRSLAQTRCKGSLTK